MNLGKRVKARREELGILQKDLTAAIPGLNKSALSNLENRDSESSRFARELALKLRVHQLWLEEGKGPKELAGDTVPKNESDFDITPAEVQIVKDLRIILDDVKVEILGRLAEAAAVARQYQARFGPGSADALRVIKAIPPAPRASAPHEPASDKKPAAKAAAKTKGKP